MYRIFARFLTVSSNIDLSTLEQCSEVTCPAVQKRAKSGKVGEQRSRHVAPKKCVYREHFNYEVNVS